MACRIAVLITICSLAFASSASALNMSLGNVTVVDLTAWGYINDGGDTEVLSWDGGTTDEMFEWFGYLGNDDGMVRVDSENFDLVGTFDDLDGDGVATANLTLNATGASSLGLDLGEILITHTFTLIDDPATSDDEGIAFGVKITNNSGSALSFSYYQYLDIDADGDFDDDGASGDVNGITVEDNDGARTHWLADGGADFYEVNKYKKVRDKLDGWNNSKNLGNKGLPFGPNKDFTGAMQIDVADLQDQSFSFVRWRVIKGPEPGTGLLLGFGLWILGLAGRRRRLTPCVPGLSGGKHISEFLLRR